MTIGEIEDRFKKTIDQYFAGTWMKSINQTTHFIGGVTDGQISITDILK